MNIRITTKENREVIDITDEVMRYLPADGAGIAHIFVQHTTASVTTIDSDPGIDLDLFDFLTGITPDVKWRHPHNPDHAPAHLISSIIGPSVSIPFENGHLQLGTWQQVVLIELDGPRERTLVINITPV